MFPDFVSFSYWVFLRKILFGDFLDFVSTDSSLKMKNFVKWERGIIGFFLNKFVQFFEIIIKEFGLYYSVRSYFPVTFSFSCVFLGMALYMIWHINYLQQGNIVLYVV